MASNKGIHDRLRLALLLVAGASAPASLALYTLRASQAAAIIASCITIAGLAGLIWLELRKTSHQANWQPDRLLNQTVFNSLQTQIAVLDKSAVVLAINRAWREFASQSEINKLLRPCVGMNYLEAASKLQDRHYEDALAIQQGLEAILNCTQQEFTYEYLIHTERSRRWFLVAISPLSLTAGGAVVTHNDITERKRAEKALLESQNRFKRIAEQAPDMIFRWSQDQGFEYVSPVSFDVSGYHPEEYYANAKRLHLITHPEDLPMLESTLTGGEMVDQPGGYCSIRCIHKEGQVVHLELRVSPIYDEEGRQVAVEGIVHDISAHVIARERLRELRARISKAHEEERLRIARELHDEIGQMLTIAKLRMQMAINALPSDQQGAQDKLAALADLLDETLQSARALSHELRPPLLDEIGWEPALTWLCDSFSQRTGLTVRYAHSGLSNRLDPEIELTAYRVVQEALTNIIRHADAQTAEVFVELNTQYLNLTIKDDGKGFSLKQVSRDENPHTGLGLLDMRERVSVVGGEMTIEAAPGQGTSISARIPYQEAKEK